MNHLLALAALVSLPFLYNSCQGGFSSKKTASAGNLSSSCKVALEKGAATKIVFDENAQPAVYANSKIALRSEADASTEFSSKADGTIELAEGTELSVIVNNQCLQEAQDHLATTVISKAIAENGGMLPQLHRQAYVWNLDRVYSDVELNQIANQEPCVIGISWNKKYEVQAAFNDSNYGLQAHFAAVNAEASYPKFYNTVGGLKTTGTPVVVAVMDTGVDFTHPDLTANFWAHRDGWGIDITTLNSVPVDYNPRDISPIGHGTHVAGLIAAISNNSIGTVGLMPNRARIMAIKVFKKNSSGDLVTNSTHFYNGVQFAYYNGAAVINISLAEIQTYANSDANIQAALDEAVANGMMVVTVMGNASSGNGALVNNTTLSSIPGQYGTKAGVIAVTSLDSNSGSKSYFSHYSPTYSDIAAPGADSSSSGLYSTLPVALGQYGRLAGTSQAAPLVAAASAMVIGMIRDAYGVSPTPAETERLIVTSAKKVNALKTYVKDGNSLDLSSLADYVMQQYPKTAGGAAAPMPLGGCN